MKINKQLFEDVLSGKLKGTFVLRNKLRVKTKFLMKSNFKSRGFLYKLHDLDVICAVYTEYGKASNRAGGDFDIIDFIPDTDIKENELTIEIPKGKIVDWDESKKQNKIVLKDKQLTYEDICEKLFNGEKYYTDASGGIRSANIIQYETDPNNATTKHQLECIMAKNQLANVCKFLNGNIDYSTIESCWSFDISNKIIRITYYRPQEPDYYQPQFVCKSKELAEQAIEILGEETVRLALEPLGI